MLNLFKKKTKAETQTHKEVKAEQRAEKKYLGSHRMHKGHKVFELNMKTGEMGEAKIERDSIMGKDGVKKKQSIVTKKDCIYIPALNEKNAWKKAAKRFEK